MVTWKNISQHIGNTIRLKTALVKVKTDLLAALDNKEVACLILLDLSAAFDTVNHRILLNRLKYRFGFGERVLSWVDDYLSERSQQVLLEDPTTGEDVKSAPVMLIQGVPQGSF